VDNSVEQEGTGYTRLEINDNPSKPDEDPRFGDEKAEMRGYKKQIGMSDDIACNPPRNNTPA